MFPLRLTSCPLRRRNGQGIIVLVLLFGTIIIAVASTISFVTANFVNYGYGFYAGNQALAAASGGAEDALLRLLRNKDFSSSGYSVPIGNITATVSVTQNYPATGQARILSKAAVSSRVKQVEAIASVDSNTGEIALRSWKEI